MNWLALVIIFKQVKFELFATFVTCKHWATLVETHSDITKYMVGQ